VTAEALSANLSPQTGPGSDSTPDAPQEVLAGTRTPGRNLPGRAPNGTADRSTLPHSCGGCDSRWSGGLTCHCGSCHNSFGGVSNFDRHRRNGQCVDPAELGLSLLSGRAYPCWGSSEDTTPDQLPSVDSSTKEAH
jgi:hypothetical protein